MKIEGIINSEDQSVVINELKSKRYLDQPDIEKSKKGLDPLQHDVFNKAKRPDKKVKIDTEDGAAVNKVILAEDSERGYRLEPVARIAVSLQKLIVKRAVAFLFGNAVEMNAEPEGENQKLVLKALKRILYDV